MPAKPETKRIHDPKLYEKLSKPYASREEAAAALHAFFDGVRKLRKKHGISDAYIIAACNVANPDDPTVVSRSFNGASSRELPMVAWAFGAAKRDAMAEVEAIAEAAASSVPKELP